jgi:hypothetical protein
MKWLLTWPNLGYVCSLGGELGLRTWQDWRGGAGPEIRRWSWAAATSRRRSEPILGMDPHEAREA